MTDYDRFVELLIDRVRDPSIRNARALAAGQINGSSGKRWKALSDASSEAALVECAADAVDEAIWRLLEAIDAQELLLTWVPEDGSPVDLNEQSNGAHGEYASDDGYRKRFSQETWSPL